jgi:transcriptional repressor NrdR
MRCPFCGNLEDKVIESRQNTTGTSIRRRRKCLNCKGRFTSYEQVEEKKLMVIKRDGSREPFDISKVAKGMEKSLEKRAVSTEKKEEILQQIEDEANIIGRNSREIETGKVGDLVLKYLFKIDKVAYVRFASVYRMFSDVNEFIKEIENFPHRAN